MSIKTHREQTMTFTNNQTSIKVEASEPAPTPVIVKDSPCKAGVEWDHWHTGPGTKTEQMRKNDNLGNVMFKVAATLMAALQRNGPVTVDFPAKYQHHSTFPCLRTSKGGTGQVTPIPQEFDPPFFQNVSAWSEEFSPERQVQVFRQAFWFPTPANFNPAAEDLVLYFRRCASRSCVCV
jgi:hypothetical protein